MSEGKPIVLIIHAQTKPPLVELDEEAANLQEALRKGGGCEPRILLAANSDRIFSELNECGDQIVAIHYAGHANGGGVMLPLSGDGAESAGRLSHIEGLAGRLKQLKNLRFVFLNGCATKDQVTDIIEAEIPAVIATLRGIDDRVARDFATEFYRSFASDHSIDEAFQSAESRIKEHKGGNRRGAYSEAAEVDDNQANDWPWKLYGTRDAKGWKIGDAGGAAVEDDLSIAGKGFDSLKTLVLEEPEVKAKVVSFQSDFTTTREGIRVLNAYKAMHDVLHTLQFQCHDILAQVCKLVAVSDMSWSLVGPVESTLRQQLDRGITFREHLPPGDTMWFSDLENAAVRLGEASSASEPEALADADNQINRVISVHLATINTRLSSQARNLRLDQSLLGLSKIAEWLEEQAADSDESRSFQEGMEAFGRIDKTLAALVDRHDGWQNVDRELRPAEASLAIGTQLVVAYWPNIQARVNELCEQGDDEGFVEKMRSAEEKLTAAIADDAPNKIEPAFRDYYRLAMQQFFVVDLELKELCGNLDEVGEKLSLVLRELA